MRLIVTVILLFALSGCAYFKKQAEEYMNSLIGYTEQQMLSAWGGPSKVYENDGMKYMTWVSGGSAVIPQIDQPSTVIPLSCSRTFVLKNNRVISWSYRGNNCY